MAKYQQYEEYKDSGVEWLGEIPKNWEVVRLKYIAELSGNKISGSENQYVGLENVESKTGKFKVTEGIVSEGVTNTFEKDNLLFGKLRPYLAKSWLASFSGICSSEFLVLNSQLVHPKFLKYMTLTDEFVEQVNSSTYGSKMPRASWDFIGLLQLPVMDYGVSEIIANFLDHETAQIDTLIEKQQTLIQLLKEKRQAVISHAVTKGLNPDAPMKDSGVEWLREVPEHWSVKKNKHLLEFVTSGSRGWAEYYSDEGKLFFRITNLTRDTIEPKLESVKNVNPPSGAEGERSKIELNDLLISITADLGSVCVANDSITGGFVSQHVSLCRPNSSVKSARWLAYFILSDSAKEQFVGSGYGGTKIQLSLEDIRELSIAYPPKKEQEDIALYIDKKLEKFEILMNQAEQAIQLMQERRTALISAAVTGKIDVRGWRAGG